MKLKGRFILLFVFLVNSIILFAITKIKSVDKNNDSLINDLRHCNDHFITFKKDARRIGLSFKPHLLLDHGKIKTASNKNFNHSAFDDFKVRGYLFVAEINYGYGIGQVILAGTGYPNIERSVGIKVVNGFQFDSYTSLGLGIGIESYNRVFAIPITVDGRVTFNEGRSSPFVAFNGGYIFSPGSVTDGAVINPSFGYKIFMTNNLACIFHVGYKLLFSGGSYYPQGNGITRNEQTYWQFVTFTSGVSF